MIFCFVRETKQLTLEEIDRKSSPSPKPPGRLLTLLLSTEVFSVPTKEFLAYETGTWLPYFVKRYILRRKIAKPPPLIAWAAEETDSENGTDEKKIY